MNASEIPGDIWRVICQDADDPLAIVQISNYFVWVNPAFERLVGYSVVELIGKTWMEITEQKDVGGDLASVRAVIEGKYSHYRMEKNYIHKRGGKIPVEIIVRRWPESSAEEVLCFRVEASPSKATRPELDEVLRMVEELKFQIAEKSEKPGVLVQMGDQIRQNGQKAGGDIVGNDKITNSDKTQKYMMYVMIAMIFAMIWVVYYVVTKDSGNVVAPPNIPGPGSSPGPGTGL